MPMRTIRRLSRLIHRLRSANEFMDQRLTEQLATKEHSSHDEAAARIERHARRNTEHILQVLKLK